MPWAPCFSPQQYGNLSDGHFTFEVTATDRAGNRATPEAVDFLVDTQPPNITTFSMPPGSRTGDLTAYFAASDGTGSGIRDIQCKYATLLLDTTSLPWRRESDLPPFLDSPILAISQPIPLFGFSARSSLSAQDRSEPFNADYALSSSAQGKRTKHQKTFSGRTAVALYNTTDFSWVNGV